MNGNMGKILEVDLTSGKMTDIELDEGIYRDYMGGTGLAAKLLYDRGDLDVAPLDPAALLIFACGPLTGINFSGSSRFSVGARSPLTGIWGQASCGGNFGPELKRCGYDGMIFKGKAGEPVYLHLSDDGPQLFPATDLEGKDTYETIDILKEKYEKAARVLAIGPASENGVLYGNIVNDYGHTFGRSGMGTVMGSKNLKAIVARGSRKPEFKDPEKVKELAATYREEVKESVFCQVMGSFGTGANMEAKLEEGGVPCKNWSMGYWEKGDAVSGISMASTILTGQETCRGCAVKCKRVVKVDEEPYKVPEGPGPEYETLASLGTLILNDNLPALAKANETCNKMGLDTITVGATIAWAMECFEKGIMKPGDYDGNILEWGDMDAVISLVNDIAAKKGKLGALLAKGSQAAASEVGNGSEAFLTTTKGLEAPMHDPRCLWGLGPAYAMSVRGACHVSHYTLLLEFGAMEYPEIGLDKNYKGGSAEFKSDMVVKTTDLGCITNSACWCQFPGTLITIPRWVELFNSVAGYDYDMDKLMDTGARIWYLQRCLGHIWGMTAADDKLSERNMTPVDDGGIAGVVPDMNRMMKEVYELRGLREDGKPSREVLEKYGLGYLADRIGV